jgi:hypothetical protein
MQTGLLDKKTWSNCFLSAKTHSTCKDTYRLKVKEWKMFYQVSWSWKQARLAIFKFDKVYFKPKLVRRHKEGHYILIKGTIHQDNITIVNIYASNVGVPDLIK